MSHFEDVAPHLPSWRQPHSTTQRMCIFPFSLRSCLRPSDRYQGYLPAFAYLGCPFDSEGVIYPLVYVAWTKLAFPLCDL